MITPLRLPLIFLQNSVLIDTEFTSILLEEQGWRCSDKRNLDNDRNGITALPVRSVTPQIGCMAIHHGQLLYLQAVA